MIPPKRNHVITKRLYLRYFFIISRFHPSAVSSRLAAGMGFVSFGRASFLSAFLNIILPTVSLAWNGRQVKKILNALSGFKEACRVGAMGKMTITYLGDLRTAVVHPSGARLKTNAPKDNHGKGEEFSPTDLLAVALGTCVVTLMGIAANTLHVDLTGVRAEVTKAMVSAPVRRIGKLTVDLYCPVVLEEEKRVALEKAGHSCPVHHSLHPDVEQVIRFHWGHA